MAVAIQVQNLSKAYQIGQIGTGTISRDIERWLAKLRGKEDPFLKIGEANDRAIKGESDIVWSLKDINFEIQQGDAVGIIGRNGAGKSTLLKLLSRVTSPTTGSIKARGRIASLLEVGTGFHPELTGRENIYLNGAILGMRKKEIDKKLDQIIDFSGVERYVDTPVKRYSSGMYVRLAFAVAAHLESEILIVDEVLAVGDAEFQTKCLGKMNDVSKNEGRTVLFVSHNMGSVQILCNKGIVLQSGMIEYDGDIVTAINQYNALYLKTASSSYEGSGIIKSVKLIREKNNALKEVSTLKIEIFFSTEMPIKNVVLGFIIKDKFDIPLIGVNNRHYLNKSLNTSEISNGIIEVSFDDFLLLPGTYKMDFFLGDSTTDLEEIKDALSFEIEDTQINPTAFQLDTSINKFYCKNINWRIKNV
jgi:lipopolysaccharide transport system ATP-binding protein